MRRATPTQRIRNGSFIRWWTDRSDKGGVAPMEKLNGFACMKSDLRSFGALLLLVHERSGAM